MCRHVFSSATALLWLALSLSAGQSGDNLYKYIFALLAFSFRSFSISPASSNAMAAVGGSISIVRLCLPPGQLISMFERPWHEEDGGE